MGYVLVCESAFVRPRGMPTAYTTNILEARIFRTREEAEANRCGNEDILPLRALLLDA